MQKTITPKQQRRRYRLHRNLRKRGNEVSARQRTVIIRNGDITKIEQSWLNELINSGYAVGNQMIEL